MHAVLVPLFLAGNVALVVGVFRLSWVEAVVGLALMVFSMILQGRGHGVESEPPVPFSGAANAFSRIFLEQWVTFPRFVLTGGWWRAMRAAERR